MCMAEKLKCLYKNRDTELDGHSTVEDVPPLDDILLNIARVFCYMSRMASCI